MRSAGTNSKAKGPFNISDAGPRFGSTELAAAIIRAALMLAVISALLLIAALPVQAETETVLYNFTGAGDGAIPESRLTSDGAGNFYGTTDWGGRGWGTVFELSLNGNGGWNETVLYSFTGFADGAYPYYSPVIFDSVGNLYGTTSWGGDGNGVVFELSPAGTSWTETVLYTFAGGKDGSHPANGLIMDPSGNLYGTTVAGGGRGSKGTVFELSPSGGGWTEKVIYAVKTTPAGLTMDGAGNIFGVTTSTVFELSPNGKGGWNPTVIHTFTGRPRDGAKAQGTPVLDQAGNLYGTTRLGGAKNQGTVYSLNPGGKGWQENVLYSFQGGKKDGNQPYAGIVFDAAGNIYGTTYGGGNSGDGTVFKLAPVGGGTYQESILWSFNGTDGWHPSDSLSLDSAGNLYGTTSAGGSSRLNGVVFEVTP